MVAFDTLLKIRVNIQSLVTSVNCGGVSRRGVITSRSLFDQHERVQKLWKPNVRTLRLRSVMFAVNLV